ncbi:hypothetical protein CDFC105_63951 [Clostridioides difficile]|nr:hypothetical protein CDFC105_63951 [Clostridioides difficile]
MEVIITLGKDLQDDYESWLAVKESLGTVSYTHLRAHEQAEISYAGFCL